MPEAVEKTGTAKEVGAVADEVGASNPVVRRHEVPD